MEKTYIFGHKKPDTDSVMSAIALSYFKNQIGEKTEARVLGDINKESAYALDYFNIPKPEYLNDVKLQVKDLDYQKNFYINENESIYEGYQMMLKESVTGLPIVKDKDTFCGVATLKDLSHILLDAEVNTLETSYTNLLEILQAKKVLQFDDELKGDIIIASYRSTRIIDDVDFTKHTVLIVGDRHSVIEKAIESGVKLLVLAGDSELKDEHLELAKQNKVNIVRTEFDTFHVSRMIILSNYIKTMVKVEHPVVFEETDFVTDVQEIISKTKFTNYPIVSKKGKCLGLLRPVNLQEKRPKKVILVDHNEKLQTAEGIEEARIVEVVDHHNIGSLTTSTPINFRNMAVGSTSTIVYIMFKERNMKIPKEIAGALLSGIISDTLILKSPTKTPIDTAAVKDLATIAGVDYEKYGLDLLRAGTSLEGMTKEDILYNDYKLFKTKDKQFSIGQIFTFNFEEIEKDLNEYIDVLDRVAEHSNHSLVALYVTDVIKNGSYVIYNTKAQKLMELAYNDEITEGYFIPKCISRKKNIVPIIMGVLD